MQLTNRSAGSSMKLRLLSTPRATCHASGSGDVEVIVGDAVLMERVKSLNTLIAEKDERIAELKERIEELKNK